MNFVETGLDASQAHLWLIVLCALGGFAAGAYATFRYAPPLARTRGGVVAAITTCVLVGAAVGLAAMNTYVAIVSLGHLPPAASGTGGDASAGIVQSLIVALTTQTAVLLGLAALTYLVAPAPPPRAQMPA